MNVALQDTFLSIQEQTRTNEKLALRLSALSYEQLIEMVFQANAFCGFIAGKGTYTFSLPKSRPTNIFWRLTLKVYCRDVTSNGSVRMRAISPKHFLLLYTELQKMKQSWESVKASTTQSSNSSSTSEQDLCCICFDRVPDIVLPCLHLFCQTCIQQWNGSAYRLPVNRLSGSYTASDDHSSPSSASLENRSLCPICRTSFLDTTNAWQLLDSPPASELLLELRKRTRKLIEQTGTVVTNVPPDVFLECPQQSTTRSESSVSLLQPCLNAHSDVHP